MFVYVAFHFQEKVSVYKGSKKMDHETEATGAIGLGDATILQSFVICSKYDKDEGTRLSFAKVDAGKIL